jgi:phosphate acyltransferase
MVAIDAMGGDFAPYEIIAGAVKAARKGIPVSLYGDELRLVAILHSLDPAWNLLPISIQHCSEEITMDDQPGKSVVRKKDSSLVQAITAVAQGRADAVVSAGNSGAALVAGMLLLGKVPGILRPAIGGFLPTRKNSVFCVDLGANIDSKPEYLKQFALMGNAYVQVTKGIQNPKIGLLANGTESCKGTILIQQAHELLTQSRLNFIGNCEPHDVLNDKADVIVCEGFSGNIMLKSFEAAVQIVMQWLKDEGSRSILGKLTGLFGAPIFKRLKKRLSRVQTGGALLLGVNEPLIIAHGSSNAQAIDDAISFAHKIVSEKLQVNLNMLISKLLEEEQKPASHDGQTEITRSSCC